MIISHIYGGLGNQMFQYAAGRALAEKLGVSLKLDIADFTRYPLRQYELHNLQIKAEIASPAEIAKLRGSSNPVRKTIKLLFKIPPASQSFVQEQAFTFDASILELGDNHYLKGYWQSEKYFTSINSGIRQEFQPINPPTGDNLSLLEAINQQQSIAVHVRRGDYISNPTANKFHGTPPLSYYHEAAQRLMTVVHNPYFYIFSDDPEWVRTNLSFNAPTTFVTRNGLDKSHEDMRLMSHCKHHIIANSTFSWWGAWFGSHTDQMVIAPKKWFDDEHQDDCDLIPPSWIRL